MATNSTEDGPDRLLKAVQEAQKRQMPEIDFSLHTMEDGTTVSTTERVCKGKDISDASVL